MGSGVKLPTSAEMEISKVVTKRIVANRDILEGELFDNSNICIKRNDTGEPACDWDRIIGRQATHGYKTDDGITI